MGDDESLPPGNGPVSGTFFGWGRLGLMDCLPTGHQSLMVIGRWRRFPPILDRERGTDRWPRPSGRGCTHTKTPRHEGQCAELPPNSVALWLCVRVRYLWFEDLRLCLLPCLAGCSCLSPSALPTLERGPRTLNSPAEPVISSSCSLPKHRPSARTAWPDRFSYRPA